MSFTNQTMTEIDDRQMNDVNGKLYKSQHAHTEADGIHAHIDIKSIAGVE